LAIKQVNGAALGDRARLVPIRAASTVEEMPQTITRLANVCRIE
jgi:hypothetical protein